MPLLTLINTNGNEIYINCAQIPPKDGIGPLEIPAVELIPIGDPPVYALKIPITTHKPDNIPPEEEIKIELKGTLDSDNMILPYNGGIPDPKNPNEFITVKVI